MPDRILRAGSRTSRKLAAATFEVKVLFYSLLTCVDDFGRFEADPAIVRAACFPLELDFISEEDVRGWLDDLAALRLIVRYRHRSEVYLVLLNTRARVRADRSKYPDPTREVQKTIDQWEVEPPPAEAVSAMKARKSLSINARGQMPADDSTCQHPRADVGTRGHVPALFEDVVVVEGVVVDEEKTKSPAPAGASSLESDFAAWYDHYPLKEGRHTALEQYRAARKRGCSREVLLQALQIDIRRREEMRQRGEFVPNWPHAKTWLRQNRATELLEVGKALSQEAAADDARRKSEAEEREQLQRDIEAAEPKASEIKLRGPRTAAEVIVVERLMSRERLEAEIAEIERRGPRDNRERLLLERALQLRGRGQRAPVSASGSSP